MSKEFNDPGEALCYMVECTIASLERAKSVKRTPKSEIDRLERIIETGLEACRKFKLRDAAHRARCNRVEAKIVCDCGGFIESGGAYVHAETCERPR